MNPRLVFARLRAALAAALGGSRRLFAGARAAGPWSGPAEPEAGAAGSPVRPAEPAPEPAAELMTEPAAGLAAACDAPAPLPPDAAPRTDARRPAPGASASPPPTTSPPPAASTPPAAAAEAGALSPAPVATAAPAPLPDPELDKLLARAAKLEDQQLELSARLADMEQRVREFEHRQYRALGEVLGECLRLRHEYLRLKAERSGAAADRAGAEAAQDEFEAWRRSADEVRDDPPALDEDERDELRRLYRAAAMRCHPDRVAESARADAHDAFLRIQQAYRQRDLAGLRRILAELEASPAPSPAAPAPAAGGDGIRQRVGRLQIEVADLILAIQTLQLSAGYRQAQAIDDWDAYFAQARMQFEVECAALRAQIAALA